MTAKHNPAAADERAPCFSGAFRADLGALFRWRRDVRRFRTEPLPEGTLERLLAVASLAPSVGLSEPWRFVLVEDASRRRAIRTVFETCNGEALKTQASERQSLYARLKLAGLDEAPHHVAVFADPAPDQGHGLGRRTMPETVAYSAVMAIHTLWLAARAEGVGLGWVSILDPGAVAAILDVPDDWTFIGYLCLGHPAADEDEPQLQQYGWERRRPDAARIVRR